MKWRSLISDFLIYNLSQVIGSMLQMEANFVVIKGKYLFCLPFQIRSI